jgi:hypothetical protein
MAELPPTLNEIISKARAGKFVSAQLKKKWHKKIGPYVTLAPKLHGKVYVEVVWCVKNRRRDPDNIESAQKYILDALVEQNRIEDDSLKIIQSPAIHHFQVTDYDGFSIYIRDEEAFRLRLTEDISLPPEDAPLTCQQVILPKRIQRKI